MYSFLEVLYITVMKEQYPYTFLCPIYISNEVFVWIFITIQFFLWQLYSFNVYVINTNWSFVYMKFGFNNVFSTEIQNFFPQFYSMEWKKSKKFMVIFWLHGNFFDILLIFVFLSSEIFFIYFLLTLFYILIFFR